MSILQGLISIKMKECKHEWYVYSRAQLSRSLEVECRKCRRFGFVENPTKKEWNDALKAETERYLWEDNSRVVIWPGSP